MARNIHFPSPNPCRHYRSLGKPLQGWNQGGTTEAVGATSIINSTYPLKKSKNCFRSENSLINIEKWSTIGKLEAHFSLMLKRICSTNFLSVYITLSRWRELSDSSLEIANRKLRSKILFVWYHGSFRKRANFVLPPLDEETFQPFFLLERVKINKAFKQGAVSRGAQKTKRPSSNTSAGECALASLFSAQISRFTTPMSLSIKLLAVVFGIKNIGWVAAEPSPGEGGTKGGKSDLQILHKTSSSRRLNIYHFFLLICRQAWCRSTMKCSRQAASGLATACAS